MLTCHRPRRIRTGPAVQVHTQYGRGDTIDFERMRKSVPTLELLRLVSSTARGSGIQALRLVSLVLTPS